MTGIDPAFLATSEPLGDLALCHARLQADARYPWIVLIPRAPGAVEPAVSRPAHTETVGLGATAWRAEAGIHRPVRHRRRIEQARGGEARPGPQVTPGALDGTLALVDELQPHEVTAPPADNP